MLSRGKGCCASRGGRPSELPLVLASCQLLCTGWQQRPWGCCSHVLEVALYGVRVGQLQDRAGRVKTEAKRCQ